jgi:uncharacterized protein YeaO (DUF488 family)
MIRIKRIYEAARKEDGYRVLVDRLWPRGVSKQEAHVQLWLKDIAPSDALRKWFAHDPGKWVEFQQRYRKELAAKRNLLGQVERLEKEHRAVTLLYSAKDEEHNQAVALARFLKGAPRS